MTYATNYAIGTDPTGLATLASLSIPNPRSVFAPFYKAITLGNGMIRGAGAPVVTWHWGFLSEADRDTLRGIITAPSMDTLYISTIEYSGSDAFKTYSCISIWPIDPEDVSAGRRLEFELRFTHLVYVAPPPS